jgi:DNA gyrase/topoisomerase IV subunit A
MKISDFLLAEQDIGFKEYSKYVLFSRAIPSIIDGFKPGQRKIIYTTGLDNKFHKTAAFAGKVISLANYHHGPTSLESTINGMAAKWNNNVNFMEGDGAFGSRLVPDAASPRYTSCKRSSNFNKYYPPEDNPILPKCHDPLDPEPKFYVPTIPTVLLNGVKGISVGFATNIFPYDVKEITSIVKKIIKHKKIPTTLIPSFPEFTGTVVREQDINSIICTGTYAVKGNTLIIDELPPGITREKYLQHLDNLYQKGKITSYDDLCDKSGFKFKVRMRGKVNILKTFKLVKKYTENITVISPLDKVKTYDNPIDVIVDFVEFRLEFYKKRKSYLINKYNVEIVDLLNMLRFVKAVVAGEIIFRNKNKDQLTLELEHDKYINVHKLLSMQILSLTDDMIQKLQQKHDETVNILEHTKNTNIDDMYLKEL